MARLGSSGIDRFLGHRVKQRRLELGIARVELAEALGISHQQMAKYERGTNQLSPHLLFSIAQLFGMSVSDLFNGCDSYEHRLAPLDLPASARTLRMVRSLREAFVKMEPKRQAALARMVRALATGRCGRSL
jgi:transcriptional regulator with XRE-family HTH domain